jgi:hypothetical protein
MNFGKTNLFQHFNGTYWLDLLRRGFLLLGCSVALQWSPIAQDTKVQEPDLSTSTIETQTADTLKAPQEEGPVVTASADKAVAEDEAPKPIDYDSDWRTSTGKEIVRFENGDSLFGNLLSIQPPMRLLWKHANAEDPIEFQLPRFRDIRFGGLTDEALSQSAGHEITLQDGNLIAGEIESADDDFVHLNTWYAGRLTVAVSSIKYIKKIHRAGRPIWDGITGLNGWTLGDIDAPGYETGYWKYHSGALYASTMASIAKDIELPDVARIEMDLHWRGSLYLAIALYTDHLLPIKLADQSRQLEPDFGGFYSLYFTRSTAGLRSVTKPKVKNFPYRGVPGLTQTNGTHLEILVSKPRGEIGLVVNGKPVQSWKDTEGFVGDGTGMRFVHQGQGAIKISNFRVREWDGRTSSKAIEFDNQGRDLIVTTEGASIPGKFSGANEKTVALSSPDHEQTQQLKWNGINYISLARRKENDRNPPQPNAICSFRTGGHLNLRLLKWSPEGIDASHPLLGTLRLHPAAFARIELTK